MSRCLSNTSCEMADARPKDVKEAEKRAFWEGSLAELKQEMDTLESSFDDGKITEEEWLRDSGELQDEIAKLEGQLGKSQTGGKSEARPSAPEGKEYEEGGEGAPASPYSSDDDNDNDPWNEEKTRMGEWRVRFERLEETIEEFCNFAVETAKCAKSVDNDVKRLEGIISDKNNFKNCATEIQRKLLDVLKDLKASSAKTVTCGYNTEEMATYAEEQRAVLANETGDVNFSWNPAYQEMVRKNEAGKERAFSDLDILKRRFAPDLDDE